MSGPQRPDFASFIEVARCLNSSLDVHTVLRRLLGGVDRLLAPGNWSLLLRESSGDGLIFTLVRSDTEQDLVGMRLEPGEGIAGWVADHGETLLLPDVRADPRFSARIDQATGFATRSIVAVPLRTGDRMVGVIEIINALDERQFTEEDVRVLEAFADFAAVAIENARTHGALLEMSRNDPLTGLRNSTFFLASVDAAVRAGDPLALVFFDMDRFKPFVDTHGHVRGSAALAEVGRLMAAALVAEEVGCRFGGDEFAFLLPGADGGRAARRAQALSEVIAHHSFLEAEGIGARLGASFGWAAFPHDATSAVELLHLADERMYAAKRDGKRARTS
jgi:diguanylate cyclase (GGDEF)-like protein